MGQMRIFCTNSGLLILDRPKGAVGHVGNYVLVVPLFKLDNLGKLHHELNFFSADETVEKPFNVSEVPEVKNFLDMCYRQGWGSHR